VIPALAARRPAIQPMRIRAAAGSLAADSCQSDSTRAQQAGQMV
jgi:hypothetical protein